MRSLKYPLIPARPERNEKIYASVSIKDINNEMVYILNEPKLNNKQKETLEKIKEFVQRKIDIDFEKLRKSEVISHIIQMIDKAISYYHIRMDNEFMDIAKYYIIRDFIGMEKIEPLIKDPNIEDISCDGVGIPIYVFHRNPNLGTVKTNIVFETKEELDSFVRKMSERCGKSISMARPLLNGTLPDGSRVQATLGSDIATKGSNFTIRMYTEKPLTPINLIGFNTLDIKTAAFLWFAVEHGSSILISGGTATGKTSLLNAISLFIKPEMKIISIEDTGELRLPHKHWIAEVARMSISEKIHEIDMYKLLRESLRQRPDYIIVGEVRGREAYVLFQQMAIGHPSLSTIHAENFEKLFDRLTTKPINLSPSLLENLDIIVFLKRFRKDGKNIRRIQSISEVVGFERKEKEVITNEIIKWNPKNDKYDRPNPSNILYKISENAGISEKQIRDEIKKRSNILKWLFQNKTTDYKRIGKVMNMFYRNPEKMIERVEALL